MRFVRTALILATLAVAPAAMGQATGNATGPRFDIRRYVVEDATLLPKARIDAALKPFVGKQRDFATVQGALRALEKAYADAGYTAVQVLLPEQELKDGRIRLTVRELKVGKVIVEGNLHFNETNVINSLPAAKPGTAPNVDAIARNLRTANENPSKNTTVLLRAGTTEDTVDIVARVTDRRPWRAAFSVDSTGTAATGILRTGLSVQHSNLFNRDHIGSAQYITSPAYPNRVAILGVGYHVPIYSSGDSVDVAYVFSDVNSGNVATAGGNYAISGGGHFWSLRYNLNLPRRENWDHKFVLGADWREYSSNVRFTNGTFTSASSLTPDVAAHPVGVAYQARRRSQQDDLSVFLGVYRNIPGGAAGDGSAISASRQGANPWYTVYRYGGSYLHVLPKDWQFRGAVSGQYTNDMLIAGEQFGVGGMDSVRGFVEREIANDRGIRSAIELYTPEFGLGSAKDFRTRGLAFIDYGYLKRVRPLLNDLNLAESVSSIGVGLRSYYRENVSLRLDYARVHQGGGLQQHGDQRLHGSVSLYF